MQPKYTINGESYIAEPVKVLDDITLELDGHLVDAGIERKDTHHSELTINGQRHDVFTAQDADTLYIHLDGKTWQVGIESEFSSAGGGDGADGRLVIAPMPGVVLENNVSEGDTVTAGQTVMLIESMKLQTEIKASKDGTVSALKLEAGQAFDKGAILIEIAVDDESSEQESDK